MPRKSTTQTTTEAASKPRTRTPKPKAETPTVEEPQPQPQPSGRTVPNKARPTRLGFLTSVQRTAEEHGWKVTPLATADVAAAGGTFLFESTTTPDGGLVCEKGESKLVTSAFLVKDGSSNRMDSTYLWIDKTVNQGRRIPTVYQTLETLRTGEAAPKDDSRSRGSQSKEEAPAEPTPDLTAMTKAELVAFAGTRNISVPKANKATVIAAIEKALAA